MQAFCEGLPKEVLHVGQEVCGAPIISLMDLAMDVALFPLVLDTLRRVLDCMLQLSHILCTSCKIWQVRLVAHLWP
jgi:hypothetical protein